MEGMIRSRFLFPPSALRNFQESLMQADTLEANSLVLACVVAWGWGSYVLSLPSWHGSVTVPHTLEVKVLCVAKWLALFQDSWVEVMSVSQAGERNYPCSARWVPFPCPGKELVPSQVGPRVGSSPSRWPMWDMGAWARKKALWW